MTQKDKQSAFWSAIIAVVLIGMVCWISTADYNHTRVGEMSQETYDAVIGELAGQGNEAPTDSEIVDWWENHHGQ